MRLLEPGIREITQARIDAMEPLGRADVMEALANPIPVHVITRLLDAGDEHADQLMRWGRSLIALISSALEPEQQVAAATDVVNLSGSWPTFFSGSGPSLARTSPARCSPPGRTRSPRRSSSSR